MSIFGPSDKEKQIAARARKFREEQGYGDMPQEEGIQEGDLIGDYIMPVVGLRSAIMKQGINKAAGKGAAISIGKEGTEEAGKAAGKKSVRDLAMPLAKEAKTQAEMQAGKQVAAEMKKGKDSNNQYIGDLSDKSGKKEPSLDYAKMNQERREQAPDSGITLDYSGGKFKDPVLKRERPIVYGKK
jgi:hypothetical protein